MQENVKQNSPQKQGYPSKQIGTKKAIKEGN
jgi:hypothetical protein